MADCKPSHTPLPAGAVLESSEHTATDASRQRYQSLIGSLLYAMLGTRPDIAFAVTRLSKFNANPSDMPSMSFGIFRVLRRTGCATRERLMTV